MDIDEIKAINYQTIKEVCERRNEEHIEELDLDSEHWERVEDER